MGTMSRYRGAPRFQQFQRRPFARGSDANFDRGQDFWCETCDRGFRTQPLLDDHLSEHQKCGIDGCKFVGHPKVVTKHIEMQHSTGLYSRIRNVETPEDIERWISERKKNYPTKDNVLRKASQSEERIDRGEKLHENKSRFNKRENRFDKSNKHKKTFNNHKRKTNNRKNHENNKKDTGKSLVCIPDEAEDASYCNIRPFKGISKLDIEESSEEDDDSVVKDDLDIEDEDWPETKNAESQNLVCKALTSLFDAYKSSEEEDETVEKETKNVVSEPKERIVTKSIEAKSDEDSGPEEVSVKRTDDSNVPILDVKETNEKERESERNQRKRKKTNVEEADASKKFKSEDKKQKHTNQRPQHQRIRPPTLLEKLLEKEIRHERNVVLQCINYVVKNNFFDNENNLI